MKKVLILAAMFLLVILNCSKKTTTNNYYYDDGPEEGGAMVGVVHPAESQAQVTAYMGIPIASTQIDSVGYFKLSGLPAGDYKVLVQAGGYRDYVSKPNIRITDGATAVVDTVFLISIHELIYSVWPYDGAQEVKPDESIRVSFYSLMNQTSFEAAFDIEPTVKGEFQWNTSKLSVDFIPGDALATNTRYQVTIDTTASDTAGIKLLQAYRFSFTTEPIRIEYTDPRRNQTEVSPLTRIRIYFNTDMDVGSVNSAFKMVDSGSEEVMGDFVWSSQRHLEFRPNSTLAPGETYTVTIAATASDVRGTNLPGPYQFSFTTESIGIRYSSPGHDATQVSPLTSVRITFNTDMDIESVNSAFTMVDSESDDVNGDFYWSQQQSMEFRPDSPLVVNETYTVTIETGASSVGGAKLPEPYRFSFTTAPITISSSPDDNDTEVSPFVTVRITFNTYMITGAVNAAFKMVDSDTEEVMGEFVWLAQNRMEFRPSSALALNEEYAVTIDTTASDIHGAKLSEPYQFSFTTEPIRISSSPGNNDAWVSPTTKIRISFNTDMNMESVNSAFKMVDSELNEVTGNRAWYGPSGMDFSPWMALAVSEKYTVTIDTSARTLRGAKLLESYQFSFTTQPIIILSTAPKNKETWVLQYTTIRIAFNTDMDTESLISAFKMVDSELNDVSGEFVSHDLSSVEFYPDPILVPGEVYTVTISATAADLYGKTLGSAYSFWFKTRP
ncbi:MAG: Ig-like domain-containing protein [Candidatus Zixiibacteriota bacterium]